MLYSQLQLETFRVRILANSDNSKA